MVLVLAALYHYYSNNNNKDSNEEQTKRRLEGRLVREPMNADTLFRDDVRQAWIQAVFGSDFEAGVSGPCIKKDFVISPNHPQQEASLSETDDEGKLGMTVSRLALGLYVHSVTVGSEAYFLNIPQGAILVSINGLGFLAEPSRQALERIWQYEGYFTEEEEKKSEGTALSEPIEMQFYYKGLVRKYLFLCPPPYGILFGPCGNFPLVRRVYAQAAQAGVPRGSLLARVNKETFIENDHVGMALALKEEYMSRKDLALTLVFPPSSARTSHYDKETEQHHSSKSPQPKWTKKSDDGVIVNFYPLEFNLCHSGREPNVISEAQELATQVAAGRLASPSKQRGGGGGIGGGGGGAAVTRIYSACPKMENLLDAWDPLDALLYCLRLHAARYEEERFELIVESSKGTIMDSVRYLTSRPQNNVVGAFLLQFIGIICAPTNTEAQDLTSILLKVSRRDEGFCQRLYFLLRSYISTLETPKPERNLVALLNCLELLRFAENEIGKQGDETPPTPVPVSPIQSPGASTQLTAASPQSIKSSKSSKSSKSGKKGFFGRFRKKKLSSSQSMGSTSSSKSFSMASVPRSISKRPPSPVVSQSPSVMYENMSDFLGDLDRICGTIERSLQKSFRQKMADWAMQPWSPSKDSALAEVTAAMRSSLKDISSPSMLLVNPVDSTELLSSVDCDECYILPSAHFPILLTFNVSERRSTDVMLGEERLYRTKVELISLKGVDADQDFVVQAAVGGSIDVSGVSHRVRAESNLHHWTKRSTLIFDTRSSWGAPQTLSLRLAAGTQVEEETCQFEETDEMGYGWLDLSQFESTEEPMTKICHTKVSPIDKICRFDEHGEAIEGEESEVEIKIKVTTESIGFGDATEGGLSRKRMLLYKHDDDLRQEAFAVQFIKTCDEILKASGLDLKLLTFECIPVGTSRGFVEWVPGSVPLSEVCEPMGGSFLDKRTQSDVSFPSMFAKAGLSKYESLRRLGGQQNESLQKFGNVKMNPILDYLRSVAYDAAAPYMIRKEVMDNYVKSCAGYSVISYILGVGDRHLDNLLLHQSGRFFHCDYSFILGADPKMYLPVRVTSDMIDGMGGVESDNYARFMSLVGATFLALRRPGNARLLMSMVRLMEFSCVPDISENQTTEQAVIGLRDRLRLDLNEQEAIAFMEHLIENAVSSKVWMAVDAIHSLGKKF